MSDQLVCDLYDAALFDLDGVIYLGPNPVEGAPEGVAGLRDRGVRVGFVTNNAARPPQVVSDQLTRIGVPCSIHDVVTSAQAAARMLAEALEPGAKVLVTGTQALADEVTAVGLSAVWDRHDDPVAVIQGYDPDMTWPRVTDAVHAIQAGAQWFACNLDLTRPTNLGLEPGVGTQIGAVGSCFPEMEPEVAGKPFPPLLKETVRRLGASAPIFVGDRLDTDIEGGFNVGMDSFFVFTGAHGYRDLLTAIPAQRPSHIGYDVRGLLEPIRTVKVVGTTAECAGQEVALEAGALRALSQPADREAQLDLLWAGLQLVWESTDQGKVVDTSALESALTLLH